VARSSLDLNSRISAKLGRRSLVTSQYAAVYPLHLGSTEEIGIQIARVLKVVVVIDGGCNIHCKNVEKVRFH
jgi:hypothetical protein